MNVTVTIQCNGTDVYKNTTEVEYGHTPMNITGSVSVPQYEQCTLSVVFSNAVGSSEPLFCECFVHLILININFLLTVTFPLITTTLSSSVLPTSSASPSPATSTQGTLMI